MKTEEFRKKCIEMFEQLECCGTPMIFGKEIDCLELDKTIGRAVCRECGNYVDVISGQFDDDEIDNVLDGLNDDKK